MKHVQLRLHIIQKTFIRYVPLNMHSFKDCGKLKSLTYQGSKLRVDDIFSGRKNIINS